LSVAVVVAAVLIIACKSSGRNVFAVPTPTAGQGAATTASPNATRPAGTRTPPVVINPTPAGTSTPISGASLPGRLPELSSYQYKYSLCGTAGMVAQLGQLTLPQGVDPNAGQVCYVIRGRYVRPDRSETTFELDSALLGTQTVISGQQWQVIGGQLQGPTPVASVSDLTYSYFATFWDTAPQRLLDGFACGNTLEPVFGVAARRCTADGAVIMRRGSADFIPGLNLSNIESNSSAELWVTETNKPMKLDLLIFGRDNANRAVAILLEFDITDINVPITIDPPR
jgi:hypothetical protein